MDTNWYGLKHKEVAKRFEGELSYINTFCVKNEYKPVAVYKSACPNRDKGHKDYVLLQTDGKTLIIRGMDQKEMNHWRFQMAIACKKCNDVIYSVMRHDDRSCNCGEVYIDGGRDYTKISGSSDSFAIGEIDLLTNDFVFGEFP